MQEQSYNPVSQPEHYSVHPSGIEPINITKHESFLRGNVIKYVMRAPYKGNELQDMKKAAYYLQVEIERLEARVNELIGNGSSEEEWTPPNNPAVSASYA